MRHGYRLEWLGTERLPWGDAVAILQQQKAADSAVHRALYPDVFDHSTATARLTEVVDRLEFLAVLLQRQTLMLGNRTEVTERDLPAQWADLFSQAVVVDDDELMQQMAAIDRLQGR